MGFRRGSTGVFGKLAGLTAPLPRLAHQSTPLGSTLLGYWGKRRQDSRNLARLIAPCVSIVAHCIQHFAPCAPCCGALTRCPSSDSTAVGVFSTTNVGGTRRASVSRCGARRLCQAAPSIFATKAGCSSFLSWGRSRRRDDRHLYPALRCEAHKVQHCDRRE
jgi:hypothetical protein